MKRFSICALLIVFILIPLCAKPLVISLIDSGFRALDPQNGIAVDLQGQQVYLGGSTLRSLKKTLQTHDFRQLPFDQRSELYEKARVSITWPVFKNLLVGFGSGSQLQGDLGGRLFGQIADWTAFTTIGVGMGIYLIDFLFIQMLKSSYSFNDPEDPLQELAKGIMVVGAIGLLAERVIQAVLPLPYGLRYNKTLRTGLNINKDGSDRLALGLALSPPMGLSSNQGLKLHLVGKLSVQR
ncbi:MAG: P13 family porin [Sphaerochaetaceae bacterium]|jgi:hypothetical protein|nr:P13 family porin [Sphaerochaetaceae bacterium]